MPAPIDFDALMADLTQFQQTLAEVHASLTRPQEREILGGLLGRIQEARSQVEATYPQALETIRQSAQRTQAEAEAGQARLAAMRQQLQALQEAAAQPPAVPPPKPETPLDPTLGPTLRREVLRRYGDLPTRLPEEPRQHDGKEIWEDWE
jgi:polyhydroxyalkanoate synthesis regulator phasin